MAKTLTAAATACWKRKHGRHETFTVEYKRRYWNGSAYVYESAWTVLTPSDVPAPGSISWKLDTTTQNTILASNVTLVLDNTRGEWLPTKYDPSIFAADAVATLGYEPYMTKFRVQHGYILDDGTTELLSLFVGYLCDFSLRGGRAEISYTIKGSEILLENADAQNVSDAFTLEDCSPAAGDGTNKEFLTTSIGVWQISVVQQNGSTKTQGTDYTLSQMDETGAAKITMVAAPTAGHTMKCTGRKWKAAQTIEALIGLLCDEAGIGSGVRTINPVIIPGSTAGKTTLTTQAHWEAGSVIADIDTTTTPNSFQKKWFIADDFSQGNISRWTSTDITAAYDTGQIKLTHVDASEGYVKNSGFAKVTGTWEWKVTKTSSPNGRWLFVFGTYALVWTSATNTAQILTYPGLSQPAGSSDFAVPNDSTQRTFRVTRASNGVMKAYLGGVLQNTTDVGSTTDWTPEGLKLAVQSLGTDFDLRFDDIYYSPLVDGTGAFTNAGVFESAEQDILSTPTAWGTLDTTETLNGGTVTYATASSTTSGGSYSAYQDIVGGVIQSPLRRYWKVRATLTVDADNPLTTPVVADIAANFSVSTINLTIANFGGKTCFDAIQDLAKIADYEWGFEGDGDFFFRSKTVSGAADLDLDQDNAILALTQYKPGWDRVINAGQVKYGADSQYYSEYNGTTAGESEPTSDSRFFTRPKSESMNYLLANDVNLGTARARLLYEGGYLPKARATITLWMTPQVDLADIVSVNYYEDPKMRSQILGDNLLTWGDDYTGFGDPMNVALKDKRMKVVGVTYSLDRGTTDLELLEVL